MDQPTEHRAAVRWAAAAAFVATFCAVAWSLLGHRQLGDLQGISDEWLRVAVDSARYGDLALGGRVTMFKPPGYPAFLRAVLWLSSHAPTSLAEALAVRSEGNAQLQALGGPIYWAHGLVLALAAGGVCVWLSRFMRVSLALAGAICFGVNPYVLAYVGTPHYAIVYMALIVACCWATERALSAADTDERLPLVTAGLLWGLATLVRPVTLMLGPFLLVAFAWRGRTRLRPALLRGAAVALTMYVAIAPWTVRNYLLTGRVVPVSAQAWLNTWAAVQVESAPDPNHYRWKLIRSPFKRLLRRVAPQTPNTDPYGLTDNVRVEDVTREAVLARIRRSPGIYLRNALGSFYSYHVHINSILIGLFGYIQTPGARLKSWYWPDQDQTVYDSRVTDVFVQLFRVLSVLALGGLVLSLRRTGPPLLGTVATHFCFAAAHSIVWMDTMYYSTKWPFVIVLAFGFVASALGTRGFTVAGRRWRLDDFLGWTLALGSVALTVALLR